MQVYSGPRSFKTLLCPSWLANIPKKSACALSRKPCMRMDHNSVPDANSRGTRPMGVGTANNYCSRFTSWKSIPPTYSDAACSTSSDCSFSISLPSLLAASQ